MASSSTAGAAGQVDENLLEILTVPLDYAKAGIN